MDMDLISYQISREYGTCTWHERNERPPVERAMLR